MNSSILHDISEANFKIRILIKMLHETENKHQLIEQLKHESTKITSIINNLDQDFSGVSFKVS